MISYSVFPPRRVPDRTATARVVVALLLGATLAACGSRTSTPNPFDRSAIPGAPGTEDPIRIEVQNLNFNDITIWAIRQGQRVRVGRVSGKSEETFRISWNVALPISFFVDAVGGRTCRTVQVSVEREGRVWLAVPANLGYQPCRIGRR